MKAKEKAALLFFLVIKAGPLEYLNILSNEDNINGSEIFSLNTLLMSVGTMSTKLVEKAILCPTNFNLVSDPIMFSEYPTAKNSCTVVSSPYISYILGSQS